MARQKIIIRLTSEDKDTLNSVISKGTSRAHILLKSNAECDKQYTIDELADLLNTSKQTVCRVLKEYKVTIPLRDIAGGR